MKRKRLLGSLFGLLLLSACLWLAWQANTFLTSAPETPGKQVLFDVLPGARLAQVAAALEHKGCVTSASKFRWLAHWKQCENRLQAGRFALNTGWTPDRVLHELVNGRPVLFRVTVPEGLTWWQTARLLENAGFVHFEDFSQIVMDPDFLRHYGIPFASAEGFLMPDTYLLPKKDVVDASQARAVAGRMVDNFWNRAASLWPDGKVPGRDALRTCTILASIVEKETAVDAERARVAGVYRNRLDRGMLLQADPTVIYGLGENFDGNLRRSHLDDGKNPYNTYQRSGLPPGPICSFGTAALSAALHPEAHKYLYFVAKVDGGEHVFSTNIEEHNRAVRRYLQNRRQWKNGQKTSQPSDLPARVK
ncbi:MAG: endolytic transglycosylase MltG [Desulfovibrio sp.]|nr:endolytic transglycosylase MltG [Desulfovibrio sp.]